MFALVRFVSDLDKRPHVIPVSDIEALHPTHETDFDGKALYVAFWRDPAGKASGSYSVQVLMLAGVYPKVLLVISRMVECLKKKKAVQSTIKALATAHLR